MKSILSSGGISIPQPDRASTELLAIPLQPNAKFTLAHVLLAQAKPFVLPVAVAWLQPTDTGGWRVLPLMYAPFGANVVADHVEAKERDYRVLSSGVAIPDSGIVTADAASGVAAYIAPVYQMPISRK